MFIPGPFGPFAQFVFKTGYGRKVEHKLLQKDCTTPITDSPFEIYYSAVHKFGNSLTDRIHNFMWATSKQDLIMSNPTIFNHTTRNITICAVARLVDSEEKYEKVFEAVYQPQSPLIFNNTWTTSVSAKIHCMKQYNLAVL
jgi:hypothetical protein